jgi:ABC-2 type transport system permease protein
MNWGLTTKALRESWPGTLMFGASLALVEALLAYSLLNLQTQIAAILSQVRFLRIVFQALFGAEAAGGLGPEMVSSIPWMHPAALALIWGHAIMYCTRVPAGEVDRGTIDVLLGLPVSRWQLYLAETVVWALSGTVILLLGVAGNVLGNQVAQGSLGSDPGHLVIVLVNLLCLYLAVGGVAWLVSALSDRRGRAIGTVFAFCLGEFLLNYLAQFWSVADRLSFLSVLHYYRPLAILRDGTWPVRDITVLLASAAALWTAGGVVFARRDLATV